MNRDQVVLLHGLGRTQLSMLLPARQLRAAGFGAVNLRYPSRTRSLDELAGWLGRRLEQRLRDRDRPLHFLTHSMGGILLRRFLDEHRLPALKRVVMLAPPNRGSALAELLRGAPLSRVILGPAGRQLGTGAESLPRRLGPLPCEVGVIAGDRARSPWAWLVAGPSDGTVRVDETRVPGMADFLVVPRGHTFLMNDPYVIRQAIRFFREGRFDHSPT